MALHQIKSALARKVNVFFPHLLSVVLFDIFVWIILVIEMLITVNA